MVVLPLSFSCTRTREQKGVEIAKSEIKKRLYNADNCEPIEIQIDGACIFIYTDMGVDWSYLRSY